MGLISLQRPQGLQAQPGAQLEEEQTTKNQDSANHVSELGTAHAEAGNGIEASDAPDVSKPQPLQIDLKQGQFVGRPALQLRNFAAHSMEMLQAKMGQVKQKEEQEGKVET